LKNENFLAPIGLCAISAIALREGHEVFLCEVNAHDPFSFITKFKPDIIAYSSSTGEAKHYLGLNRLIKKRFPGIFTVMGGPHPTFYPDVIYEDSLDAICIGEGEGAFVELLRAISAKKSPDNIPNIITRSNKHEFTVRNLVEDLDSLPFPDFALIYNNTPLGKYPLKNIITSRGCPYDCTYCFNPMWRKIYQGKGRAVRQNSVNYIVDEISYVRKNWPLSFVKFYDDIFVLGVDDWLEEFSKKYKKHINLPFFILTRADILNEAMVRLLKEAGCHTISMSIEAGNPGIRNKMLKRNMTDQQIINAFGLCDKYGIHTFTNCIIGLPGTTIDNDVESIDLSIKCKATWAEFLIFHPFPGTQLGDLTVKQGYYKPDYELMHTSYQHSSPLNCFSEKEKNALMNIAVLGAVAVAFSRFRNLIVRRLIFLKYNPSFTFFYYVTKMYILRRKIYVTKTSFGNSLVIFAKSLKQEWFRHQNKRG